MLVALLAPLSARADCKPARLADGRSVLIASWPEASATAPAAAKVCFLDVLRSPGQQLIGCVAKPTPVVTGAVTVEGKSVPLGTACGPIPAGLTSAAVLPVQLQIGAKDLIRAYAESADAVQSLCESGAPCDRAYALDLRRPPPTILLDLIIEVQEEALNKQSEALDQLNTLREQMPDAPEAAKQPTRRRR